MPAGRLVPASRRPAGSTDQEATVRLERAPMDREMPVYGRRAPAPHRAAPVRGDRAPGLPRSPPPRRAPRARRSALCGDSGAAFLPTAGVGASVAMRSAAALADELSKTDAAHLPLALDLYVRRCRKLALGNQDDSRTASRLMFVRNPALGWARDQLVKHYSAQRVLRQIIASMHQPF
jgi:2-polyprenyl-6-methoxyphenol hydroxylase-like FAD-dependent oxidoreductase